MSNMLDYLRWRGDLSFEENQPNEIDLLIFSQLVHVPFEGIQIAFEGSTLSSLRDLVFTERPPQSQEVDSARWELWQLACKSRRFGEVRLDRFLAHFDPSIEKQFAAAEFRWGNCAVLAYRGTDSTLVGWKEDFNMGFLETVPSQQEALAFLETCFWDCEKLYLCGHSKGGNLAMYASALCSETIQRKIVGTYSFDGPGMNREIRKDFGWIRIGNRLHSYVPESSVVGFLLFYEEQFTIVKSDGVSIYQHNPFFWHVMGCTFITEDETTASSRFVSQTLRTFVERCTVHQRKVMVNTLFDVLNVCGAKRTQDLPKALLLHMDEVNAKLKDIPEEERKVVNEAIRIFLSSSGTSAQTMLGDKLKNWFEEGLKKLSDNGTK